jgi:hypothetical protein
VGVDDPPIDAVAIAEIVGIDDQVAHAHSNGAAGKVGTLLTMNDALGRRGFARFLSSSP